MSAGGKYLLPPWARGLSARLLLLTMVFVMLAEVLIYLPSIARFRLAYFEDRLSNAHLAILALEASDPNTANQILTQRLLDHADASAIAMRVPGKTAVMLMLDHVPQPEATIDLRQTMWFSAIRDALVTLAADEMRTVRVLGGAPKAPGVTVELVMRESALRRAMIGYSQRILALSIFISLITAGLVFLALQMMMVRPMRRLTDAMVAFRAEPENPASLAQPSKRGDEIGVATRELAQMQRGLLAALKQKGHLAALGAAVGKINHDLRNILSTARLVSDRMTASADPYVRKTAPTLLDAIDKAVALCSRTLEFTRDEKEPALKRSRFGLRDLVEETIAGLAPAAVGARWSNDIDPAIQVNADREQLFRAVSNLARNAMESGAGRISFKAAQAQGNVAVIVADDGPGIAAAVRERLFVPFAGSTRRGGTGLGLAIAREILRAHGGDVALQDTGPGGTRFRLELPEEYAADAAQPSAEPGALSGRVVS